MENIHPIFDRLLGKEDKEQFLNQKAKTFWFTGLSGSGKSTIAQGLEKMLFSKGYFIQVIDGDNTRAGINKNLGFSLEDRYENIRRVSEITKLFNEAGVISLCSFVSPTREIRDMARKIIGEDMFYEVFINTPLEVCEARDVKGLYKKARAGEIKGFTGIDSPFEEPINPDLEVKTNDLTIEQSVSKVFNFVAPLIQID